MVLTALCLLARPEATTGPPDSQVSAPAVGRFSGIERRSVYIPMRDGVRLAATVHTPKGLKPGQRTATVLHLTRYYRLISVKPLWRPFWGFKPVAITETHLRNRLVQAGYSWIDVDERGSGASFGTWVAPYDPDSVRDGRDLLDWIVRQPWASGDVAALGSSYNAALAVMQLSHEHPALKAVVSTFGIWDLADLRPGGLRMTRIVEPLSRFFDAMDRGDLGRLSWMARLFARGVEPVEPALLREAQRARPGNMTLQRFFADLEFRDDVIQVTADRRTVQTDAINPHAVVALRATVPVLTFGGWYDNAFAAGVLRQFASTRAPGSRVRIGPWTHGIGTEMKNVSPYSTSGTTWENHADEVQRFLDRHVRGIGNGIEAEPPVAYYVMGEERWRGADRWPPAGRDQRTFYLAESAALVDSRPPAQEASDRYVEDFRTTSGGARWGFSLDGKRTRGFITRQPPPSDLLRYQATALEEPLTIVGAPVVEVFMTAGAGDGGLFVYLDEVAPDGSVRSISEGQLRLLARHVDERVDLFGLEPLQSLRRSDARPMVPNQVERVALRLLPTAYRIPAGHALRLSLAAADISSFIVPPPDGWPTYDVHRDASHPSRLILPVYTFR